ncbi:hypothetical protein CYMTET_55451 [Cymbomonas tetramitiformis]|uniref:Ribosome associated membrane protein RAMP4 n=1 Tax=Cymbomonas tetramitiformis TaxID=36881 RepID=A0AAE0BEB1_9CHLO|nr:hypothetical protein CYMTET_55451 [Cymbomonas tetramitiformis]
MTTSKRFNVAKNEKFAGNIHKRGTVPKSFLKAKSQMPVGPVMLGFFIFVVIGSALFQIIRTASAPQV